MAPAGGFLLVVVEIRLDVEPRQPLEPAGRYQFHSPSSFIAAGSRTPRMRVASSRTATASPTPICLMSSVAQRREDREHGDHHRGGARHRRRRRADAARDRLVGRHAAVDELLDPAEDEHVVVHREPEEHGEQEERQPGHDRAVRAEAEQALQMAVLEDPDEHAVSGADREQVEDDRLDRDDDRPEGEQQQQEGEPEHEGEDDRTRCFIVWLKSCVPAVSPVTAYSCPPAASRSPPGSRPCGDVRAPLRGRVVAVPGERQSMRATVSRVDDDMDRLVHSPVASARA